MKNKLLVVCDATGLLLSASTSIADGSGGAAACFCVSVKVCGYINGIYSNKCVGKNKAAAKSNVIITADKNSDANVEFETGWNLVGYPVNTKVPEEATAVYSWNEMYQSISDLNGILIQGIGYWVFVF